MSRDDGWTRAAALFERLVELPPERRSTLLDEAREADAESARMAERLLAADAEEGGPLEEGLEAFADLALEDARLQPGTRLGDFEILGEIGRGGMGLVYEARDLRLNRLAALKLLPADRPRNERDEGGSRLLAEARTASSFDHPNVATVYQVGDAPDGRRFIAMARYEGETLRERLRTGPLRAPAVLDVALQVARGLAAVHSAGIVHRDVKPENTFLTTEGPVKLLDFGISGAAGEGGTGSPSGTPTYMSPEALTRRGPPDARSDVWALGVMIGEMLDGTDRSRLATELVAISARATADRLADRFVDGQEMLDALLACSPETKSSKRRARTLVSMAVGAAAVALLGLVAVGNGEPEVASFAVGLFEGTDASDVGSGLARRLAGFEGIEFIPPERLEEVRAQMIAAGIADSADRSRVGRLAGVQVMITGTVERSENALRLTLRRNDLAGGDGSEFAELTASSDSTLLEAAVLSVADELGLPPPPGPHRRGSALADRLFEEG
ncbi:MAG: serine/threonine-protein kinase, partial [Gemmatimonadota bacterium]